MKPFGLFQNLKGNIALGLSRPLEQSLDRLFTRGLPAHQKGPLSLVDPNYTIDPDKIKTLTETLKLSVQESRGLRDRFIAMKEAQARHRLDAHRGNRDTNCSNCEKYEEEFKSLNPRTSRECALILPPNWHRPTDMIYFSTPNHLKRIIVSQAKGNNSLFLAVSDKKTFADFFQIGPGGLRILAQFRSFYFGIHESGDSTRQVTNPRFNLSTMVIGALEYYKRAEKLSGWQQLGGALSVRSSDGQRVTLTPQFSVERTIQSIKKPIEVTSSKRIIPDPFLIEGHGEIPLLSIKICIRDSESSHAGYRNYSCDTTLLG